LQSARIIVRRGRHHGTRRDAARIGSQPLRGDPLPPVRASLDRLRRNPAWAAPRQRIRIPRRECTRVRDRCVVRSICLRSRRGAA